MVILMKNYVLTILYKLILKIENYLYGRIVMMVSFIARKIEERLNKFMQHFSEYRMKEINKRNILGDSIRVVDSKFTTSMSDKLYSI